MPEPTPAAPARPEALTSFDVFISYSSRNRDWVSTELVPRLRNADLKIVIDTENFEVGMTILENITNAFSKSRFTLAVITSAWLESRWSRHERLLALSADVEEGKRRFVPLKLEACELPPELRMLSYADFTDPARSATEWDHLLGQLVRGEAGNGSGGGPGLSVKKAFRSLAGLMHEPGVRDEVVKYREVFRTVTGQIDVLTHYKYLHDLLHEIQVRCYKPAAEAALTFPAKGARLNLAEYEGQLQVLVDQLQKVAKHPCFSPGETQWIQRLLQARQELFEAVEFKDAAHLKEGLRVLTRVMDRVPPGVNKTLFALARVLPLAGLVRAMEALCCQLSRPDLDPARVKEFREGAAALAGLDQRLKGLAEDHNTWQNVDDLLRLTETQLGGEEDEEGDIEALEVNWPELQELMRPLFGPPARDALGPFREEGEKLAQALAARNPFRALQAFRRYRGLATQLFYEVDTALLELCNELRTVARGLDLLLEVITRE